MRGRALPAVLAVVVFAIPGTIIPLANDDVLTRSRAMYASLRSYADTGTVDYEFGLASSPGHERHAFKTYYRSPRHFYFDFTKQRNIDRYVVWSDDEAFYSWWQTTGVHQAYPKGQAAAVFAGSSQTLGSLTMIAPLLFSRAGLAGTLTELDEVSTAGTEVVNGRLCQKLVGVARSLYGTGHVSNVRKTTVWIDIDTLLVRRVLEELQNGPVSSVTRFSTTFEPQANPTLEDTRFRFNPPGAK